MLKTRSTGLSVVNRSINDQRNVTKVHLSRFKNYGKDDTGLVWTMQVPSNDAPLLRPIGARKKEPHEDTLSFHHSPRHDNDDGDEGTQHLATFSSLFMSRGVRNIGRQLSTRVRRKGPRGKLIRFWRHSTVVWEGPLFSSKNSKDMPLLSETRADTYRTCTTMSGWCRWWRCSCPNQAHPTCRWDTSAPAVR